MSFLCNEEIKVYFNKVSKQPNNNQQLSLKYKNLFMVYSALSCFCYLNNLHYPTHVILRIKCVII